MKEKTLIGNFHDPFTVAMTPSLWPYSLKGNTIGESYELLPHLLLNKNQ